ncbi:hypothetical protein RISW2_18185 [Roseivivax isoporae LMG 25204]|uniref:Uncharacterized protein n=1 Tax=Roseivivax isoporae LMG 25204 TaxID=1449351 RepID=X7FBV3_9RHOB|nr:hypothetical protein RISW2_18185 [Roseivivax isoporae LMG 25204]
MEEAKEGAERLVLAGDAHACGLRLGAAVEQGGERRSARGVEGEVRGLGGMPRVTVRTPSETPAAKRAVPMAKAASQRRARVPAASSIVRRDSMNETADSGSVGSWRGNAAAQRPISRGWVRPRSPHSVSP